MSVLKARIGGVWQPVGHNTTNHWYSAWGVVAVGSMAQVLAPWSLPSGVVTQITNNLSVTLTSGRRYRVRFVCRAMTTQGASASSLAIQLRNGTSSLSTNDQFYAPQTGNFYTTVAYDWLINGDDTTKSLNVMANSPTVVISLWTDGDAQFYVEDVGPTYGMTIVPDPAPAWINAVLQNNWRLDPDGSMRSPPRYRRIGDIVYVEGSVDGTGATYNQPIQLPVGYRPTKSLRVLLGGHKMGVGGSYLTRCDMSTAGVLTIYDIQPALAYTDLTLYCNFSFSVT